MLGDLRHTTDFDSLLAVRRKIRLSMFEYTERLLLYPVDAKINLDT